MKTTSHNKTPKTFFFLLFSYYFFLKVVLLSATMPADVLEVTKKFMREPVRILVKKEELTLEGIRQFYINVEKEVQKPCAVNMALNQSNRKSFF